MHTFSLENYISVRCQREQTIRRSLILALYEDTLKVLAFFNMGITSPGDFIIITSPTLLYYGVKVRFNQCFFTLPTRLNILERLENKLSFYYNLLIFIMFR